MRKPSGFTIIELMIVLAVAGALIATGLPAMADWMANSKRTAALNDFLGGMLAARSAAVTSNSRVSACPVKDPTAADADLLCNGEKEWATGWIVFIDEDADFDRAADEEVVAVGPALSGSGRTIFGNVEYYSYRPNGRLESDGDSDAEDGWYLLCDSRGNDAGRFVIIPLSGRPQISETDLEGNEAEDCP
jgi:type IV fimbrial biogenesis protein FimT